MIRNYFYIFLFVLVYTPLIMGQDSDVNPVSSKDTSYSMHANSRIINMVKPGKPSFLTLQLSFNYNIGHMDLAGNENTFFRKNEFVNGSNFGTRYGYGANLTGKIALHKQGNVRLNVTGGFNRFQSNFVIAASPEGKVTYNVISAALGIENNFTPDRKFKPYVGFDLIANFISGEAVLSTDTTDFNLKIKNSIRFGAALNLGFEYALNDKVGVNLGYKIVHANIIGRESKASSNLSETSLNDEKITSGDVIPYAGWKQFLYSSFYAGFNFYFGMKNKK
ncbi:MAG: outer membrane beta-barrel protein [Ignavibacteria bacterium]|nr:outer membrane beta-barrel protein [Ignavibacteria bacterium]MCC7159183.1 outer membrane beta-barrel protein [Ignavibacteria bacterium]